MRRLAGLAPLALVGLPAVLLALAAVPRLIAIAHGLPGVYDADEPRVVDIAVSLAGGLRPSSFKYPTLWPTLLAAFYGFWFVVWSGFGFLRGTADFAAKYLFAPAGFYLIARGLSAACQVGALAVVAKLERVDDGARWAYGALALAVSPTLVELARSAKPDSLMLLLAAGATAAALRHQRDGRRGGLLAAAFLAGLACSAHYTAAPAALIVPLAWLLCEKGPGPGSWLLQAGLVAALGFLLGTPYALIDHARFAAEWSDYADLGRLRPSGAADAAAAAAKNLWCFGGAGSAAGAAAAAGFGFLCARDARRALLLALTVAACAAAAWLSPDGGAPRALLGAVPALALLAGEGFSRLAGGAPWRRGLVAVLAAAPGVFLCGRQVEALRLPDTRAQAADWLAADAAPGSTLLLDRPSASPFEIMSQAQCAELAGRAAKTGALRATLYRAMAARHPGGGYRLLRLAPPSRADGEFLDVRPGLDTARAARVDEVVTSSFGADPRRARELATFFSELAAEADFVKEFPAEPGEAAGPWLRVFRLRR